MKHASKMRGGVKILKHLDYKYSDLTTKYLRESANYEDVKIYSIKRSTIEL